MTIPIFSYVASKGDTLADVLLQQGVVTDPAKAGKLVEQIAKDNGLPIYDLAGWAKYTGISAKAIHNSIVKRFGTVPPKIKFVDIDPGTEILSDGNKITIIPRITSSENKFGEKFIVGSKVNHRDLMKNPEKDKIIPGGNTATVLALTKQLSGVVLARLSDGSNVNIDWLKPK